MAELKILDQAHLFRIEVAGRLSADLVPQLRDQWQAALAHDPTRRFTLDLSSMTGFDSSGFKLLREMQEHGTYLSARNPFALVLLNEISSPEVTGPALIYNRRPEPDVLRKGASKATVPSLARAAGAGQ